MVCFMSTIPARYVILEVFFGERVNFLWRHLPGDIDSLEHLPGPIDAGVLVFSEDGEGLVALNRYLDLEELLPDGLVLLDFGGL